jgi:hypothetical protein
MEVDDSGGEGTGEGGGTDEGQGTGKGEGTGEGKGKGGVPDEGEPTPRNVKTTVRHPTFSVEVNSPPSPRPKQRLRINEEGDAVAPAPPPVPPARTLWVGRGDVWATIHCDMSALLIRHPGPMC